MKVLCFAQRSDRTDVAVVYEEQIVWAGLGHKMEFIPEVGENALSIHGFQTWLLACFLSPIFYLHPKSVKHFY
jgi:hypothetical protein